MDYADWTYSPSHPIDHCAWLSRVITIHAFGCSARPAFRLPNTEYRTVSPFLNVEAWAFQPKIENSGHAFATKYPKLRARHAVEKRGIHGNATGAKGLWSVLKTIAVITPRYDRQIHIWGAGNQRKIMHSTILFINCDGLCSEVSVHFAVLV